MVSDAAATKAPIARIADKVSGVFVPAVIAIAALVTVGWLLAGQNLSFALARGISVLVISCPCALGLATPVAIMVGNGLGAKNGILFKTSEALESAGKVEIVALDKTGTITSGEPKVTDLRPAAGHTEEELLRKAFAQHDTHIGKETAVLYDLVGSAPAYHGQIIHKQGGKEPLQQGVRLLFPFSGFIAPAQCGGQFRQYIHLDNQKGLQLWRYHRREGGKGGAVIPAGVIAMIVRI